jgi:hypothetical protein
MDKKVYASWCPLPNRLIIVNGEIMMADGSNLKSYLLEWQSKSRIADGELVVIRDRISAESIQKTLMFSLVG